MRFNTRTGAGVVLGAFLRLFSASRKTSASDVALHASVLCFSCEKHLEVSGVGATCELREERGCLGLLVLLALKPGSLRWGFI